MRKEAGDLPAVVRNLLEANGFLSPAQKAMQTIELIQHFVKALENQHALSLPGPVSTPHETEIMSPPIWL